jgi:hypothetical protein
MAEPDLLNLCLLILQLWFCFVRSIVRSVLGAAAVDGQDTRDRDHGAGDYPS